MNIEQVQENLNTHYQPRAESIDALLDKVNKRVRKIQDSREEYRRLENIEGRVEAFEDNHNNIKGADKYLAGIAKQQEALEKKQAKAYKRLEELDAKLGNKFRKQANNIVVAKGGNRDNVQQLYDQMTTYLESSAEVNFTPSENTSKFLARYKSFFDNYMSSNTGGK